MKKLNDDEIQSILEAGLVQDEQLMTPRERDDLDRYRFLFQRLKEEPAESLPFNFASGVRVQLQKQLNRKKDVWYYLAAFVFIFLCFGACYGLLMVVDTDAGQQFIEVLIKAKWVLVLTAVLLLSIYYLDQRVLKEDFPEN